MSLGFKGWLLIAIAWLFETLGWMLFVVHDGSEQAFAYYYTLHALAAVILGVLIHIRLRRVYVHHRAWLYLFVLLVLMFVPFVSVYGLSLGLVWAALSPYEKERPDPWDAVDVPELPYRAVSTGTGINVSFASLRQILDAALDTDKRLKAIMLSRQLPEKARIRLLQKALADPDDEVRLLAYSLLEEREKEISEQIITLQQRLKSDLSPQVRQQTLLAIAQRFWDMAYLGIAQQDLKQYFLSEADRHLSRLLDEVEQGAAWFLLGRVRLHQERCEAAQAAFSRAMELGVSEREVLPWLAEAAFCQRRYGEVVRLLARYHRLGKVIAPLEPVIRFWLGKECKASG